MKQLLCAVLILTVMMSCQQSRKNGGTTTLAELLENFPSSHLVEVIEEISNRELVEVIASGDSKAWSRISFDETNQEAVIRNKSASDNQIRFVLYRPSTGNPLLGVQQVNAQVTRTQVWAYNPTPDGGAEQWTEYPLPVLALDDFVDDRIELPTAFKEQDALPLEEIVMKPGRIDISLNKWLYMRELESNSLDPEGPLDPARIKYRYMLTFNEGAFEQVKVTEPGYKEALIFTARIADETEDGPGIHEFDCAHGVSVSSSSTLPSQAGNSYRSSNLIDKSDNTAWSEGASDSGIGEWLEYTIIENFVIGNTWGMSNGYVKNKTAWQENNRVKKFRVEVDGQFVGYVLLANSASYQTFEIAPYWIKTSPQFRKGTRIRFIVEEVYKGTRFDDTLISHFVPTGNCG